MGCLLEKACFAGRADHVGEAFFESWNYLLLVVFSWNSTEVASR
jgi:hypothetical protein